MVWSFATFLRWSKYWEYIIKTVVIMKYFILALSVIVFTGCSGKFTKPHEGMDNAKMRFVSIPSNNNFIHEANSKKCISSNGGQQIAVLGSKANLIRSLSRNGVPLYDSNISDSHQNEVYIPANDEFSFQFNGVGIAGILPGAVFYSWCRKIVTFTPKANGLYEALYDVIETPEGKETCDVKLFEISKNAGGEYVKSEAEDYNVVHNYCGS
tara:strand:+ start:652 stop:1284 length:633 start_codon:yes stop_codon:yes gene_type:complete